MVRSTKYLLIACLFARTFPTAAQSCNVPPYYSNPAYGPQSGCVPINYISAGDLGNTNPADAATRCPQQCAKLANCGGWVAQLNKAPNGLYSGSCFLYTSVPAAPRSCADKPSELVAGVRDDTGKCFTSSKSAATAFCSSYLKIGTKTVTSTAPVLTARATTTVTNTVPSTSITVSTKLDTVTSTVTTVIETATSTITQVSTTTTTVQAGTNGGSRKRDVARPACVANDIPASQLSANCKCLSIISATITTTLTPAAVTLTTTATALATTLIVEQRTTLITTTKSVTATDKTTTLTTTTTTTVVRETPVVACAAPAPLAPAGNILRNPSFGPNFGEWVTGGQGAYQNSVVGSAECGYSAKTEITGVGGIGRIGQYLPGVDGSKTYRYTLSAKQLSGPGGDGCSLLLSCANIPSDDESKLRTSTIAAGDVPQTWRTYSLDCPPEARNIEVVSKVQCVSGGAPVAIAVDEISLVPIQAQCEPSAPSAPTNNLAVNPSFSDGTMAPWSSSGGGPAAATVAGDSTCGYSVNLAAKADSSVAGIIQYFRGTEVDALYRLTVHAKKISGDGSGCLFRVFCASDPTRGSGYAIREVEATSVPKTWTQYSVDCYEVIRTGGYISLEAAVSCPPSSTGPPITIAVDEISLVKI